MRLDAAAIEQRAAVERFIVVKGAVSRRGEQKNASLFSLLLNNTTAAWKSTLTVKQLLSSVCCVLLLCYLVATLPT